MLGVIALQRQQYKKAISFIEKSISQTENPSSAQLSNLGEAYRRAGDTLRGETYSAKPSSCRHLESRFNLGITSLELNDAEGAVEAFTKLLELVPTAVDLWPHLAEAYLKAGNKEQATEAFETTLTYEPNNIAAINNLAILRENDGHIAEAIDLYRQATDIEPHVAVLHANLGIALEESGALANALVAFETAIHCAPDEPEWHIYRGSILQQLGTCRGYDRRLYGCAGTVFRKLCRRVGKQTYASRRLRDTERNPEVSR